MQIYILTKTTMLNEPCETEVEIIKTSTCKEVIDIDLEKSFNELVEELKIKYDLDSENFEDFFTIWITEWERWLYSDDENYCLKVHNSEIE